MGNVGLVYVNRKVRVEEQGGEVLGQQLRNRSYKEPGLDHASSKTKPFDPVSVDFGEILTPSKALVMKMRSAPELNAKKAADRHACHHCQPYAPPTAGRRSNLRRDDAYSW